MAYRNHHPHERHSGTARDIHPRDYNGTRSTTRPNNESSTRPSEHLSRRRRVVVNERLDHHSDDQDDVEEDPNFEIHSQYSSGQYYSHPQPQSRDNVPRSWQSFNPEVHRVIHEPALQDAIMRLEGRHQSRNRSSVRQLRPTPTGTHRPRAYSPDWYQRNSRPLGMTNLRDLDQNRNQIHAMERRLHEDQRAGPYDALGYVDQRVGTETRERRGYGGRYRQHHQYEEYDDFDDRSSDTLY